INVLAEEGVRQRSDTIGVTLNVGVGEGQFQVTPPQMTFSAEVGGELPAIQTLAIGGTDGSPLSWKVLSDQPWLALAQLVGQCPPEVGVRISHVGVVANSYIGHAYVVPPVPDLPPEGGRA